ncbi:oxidoreductase [Streptomyces minutiscleroticus]|uniref:Oxidoreductase n=1 Tax=Streptomyces minutiscleroticus TaxID=68238 RepID=A0A918NQ42_9ACTN|nr:SDR family NAD(P)-dependent oxidoreductase [Streptomyces minutiscleroticus]GGX87093.1 oxidoreductase [Streptomyces minutiscleroticus]
MTVTDDSQAGPAAAVAQATEDTARAAADAAQASYGPGIDPERLAVCLSVLEELDKLEVDHPDAVAVRRATSGIYRTVKQRRRQERRAAKTAHDKAVTEATATGSAQRIDDETEGILPSSATEAGRIAGILQRPRSCYTCKTRYVEVDYFYHQLCPKCAAENRARRDARADLTGKRALLTGGRAKIGMYIALRLLRDGAHTTITTRFPNDAVRRFKAMDDSADWIHRLEVVGIDLRDPAQAVALAERTAEQGPLDILINNATQTVRRLPSAYAALVEGESAPLPAGELPERHVIGAFGSGAVDGLAALPAGVTGLDAQKVADLALVAGNASVARHRDGTAIDAGGLVPDVVDSNTWVQSIDQISPVELLETQLCNYTSPFILISALRPAMAAAAARAGSKRAYVVNVSAMEGVFNRGYKGAGHPNTNAAKAAMNMVTRTSAQEMFETDGILMTSVDTGWITDERPHYDKLRLAEAGFHAPLDLVDGAARVYDPIVRGEQGEDLYGVFLKDYAPGKW